jgi:hypothetical protein
MNTRQPLVTCSNTVFSVLFKPREEANDERFINTLQTETFNRQTAAMLAVFEKQFESLSIRFDRIGAYIALPW